MKNGDPLLSSRRALRSVKNLRTLYERKARQVDAFIQQCPLSLNECSISTLTGRDCRLDQKILCKCRTNMNH